MCGSARAFRMRSKPTCARSDAAPTGDTRRPPDDARREPLIDSPCPSTTPDSRPRRSLPAVPTCPWPTASATATNPCSRRSALTNDRSCSVESRIWTRERVVVEQPPGHRGAVTRDHAVEAVGRQHLGIRLQQRLLQFHDAPHLADAAQLRARVARPRRSTRWQVTHWPLPSNSALPRTGSPAAWCSAWKPPPNAGRRRSARPAPRACSPAASPCPARRCG